VVTGKLEPVQKLTVGADPDRACPNQNMTFTAIGADSANWSGGGTPANGAGKQFVTQFATPGTRTVTAQTPDGQNSASATVTVTEPSGAAWVNRFPTSTTTVDLVEPFRGNADRFIAALRAAGANVNISATRRPAERAWLMHYAWRIARDQDILPQDVPDREGVDICWAHRNADGSVNLRASRAAAEDMVRGYGMRARAALDSNHIRGEAIDMTITWRNNLNITDANGQVVNINTRPRSGGDGPCGEGNAQLRNVGATYGVIKGVFCNNQDPPHWSIDGR
jgi:hypothetical protein